MMKQQSVLMIASAATFVAVVAVVVLTTRPRATKRTHRRAMKSVVPVDENEFDFVEEVPDEEGEEVPDEEGLEVAKATESHVVRTIENRGGGDCLFHCFCQAVATTTGRQVTVSELRRAVADSMTETVLSDLKAVYDGAVETRDSSLLRDFGFMEGVTTLQGLRDVVQTSAYWGDELALPALELATGLRAVVVLGDGAIPRIAARFDAPVSDRIIFVRLRRFHYELIEVDGRVVFGAESFKPPRG